jgi:hypothetical protein
MKFFCIVLMFISFSVTALAQPSPDTLWTRMYGGSGRDEAYSIQQTDDGGYIVAGFTSSFGVDRAGDFYLVKANSVGDTLWTRTYGGSLNDLAYSVQQTTDGGYIVAGATSSFSAGDYDMYLVKTDEFGDTLWTRSYGDTSQDWAWSVQRTDDGGYILAGHTASFGAGDYDMYLVKTDDYGDTLWTRTYGGTEDEIAYSIRQTTDGGYIVAGYSESFDADTADVYLVKLDDQGDTLWTRTYGGSGGDGGYCVKQTDDGGYILAGYTWSFGTGLSGDIYLVKTDSQGDTLWTRTFGGSREDRAYSVQQSSDGGYILAGYTLSSGASGYDFYLVKTDSHGDSLWTRTYGGDMDDYASCVRQTTDGGYILAGYTYSFGVGHEDIMYVVKTGPEESGTEMSTIGVPSQYILYPAFPNPFNPSAQITFALPRTGEVSLKVFNLLGQEVATLAHGTQSAGSHVVTFDGSALPSGIYFCRLQAGTFVQTQKMMLLK